MEQISNAVESQNRDSAADERILRNRELVGRAHDGDESALEILVRENIPLVRSIAHKFKDRGCEFEDLMQIGIIGMIKAVLCTSRIVERR